VEDFNVQATLNNGTFSDGTVTVTLVEPVAFGDLNGNGQEDAAVVLTVDPSGSGTFYDMFALLNQNGTPVQAAISYIGDRQGILNLQIASGRVILDFMTQGPGDPSCCPSQHRLRSYILEGNTLHLASEQILDSPTTQATPLPNAILIDQPEMLSFLTSPLHVSWRVTQAPPEMKLAYYVTDMNANLLLQGEVPIQGEAGGTGTFVFDIDLGNVSPGVFQLELVDSANGILRGRSIVSMVTP